MGKTKFGTKIVFVFVILLGAGAVLYAKNCMEQIAAYAVSLTDSETQAHAQWSTWAAGSFPRWKLT